MPSLCKKRIVLNLVKIGALKVSEDFLYISPL
jgi:hypothetical protein